MRIDPLKSSPARSLAERIEQEWDALDRASERFGEIAAQAISRELADTGLSSFKLSEIAPWIAQLKSLPTQLNPMIPFGDPAITLWHGGDFVIDLYIWNKYASGIHDHKFSGAFTVIEGLTQEWRYHFEVDEEITERVLIGALSASPPRILGPGEVVQITAGPSLIHHPAHLALPTVTLCVRTIEEFGIKRQLSYFEPGLALATSVADEMGSQLTFVKGLRYRPKERYIYAHALIKSSPLLQGILVLMSFASESGSLDESLALLEALPHTSQKLHTMMSEVITKFIEADRSAQPQRRDPTSDEPNHHKPNRDDPPLDELLYDISQLPNSAEVLRGLGVLLDPRLNVDNDQA